MILTLQENVKQNVIPKCFNVLKIVGRTLNVAVHALGTKLFVSTHAHVTPVKWPFTITPFHGNDQSKVVLDTNPLKAQEISMLFHPCQEFPGTDIDL